MSDDQAADAGAYAGADVAADELLAVDVEANPPIVSQWSVSAQVLSGTAVQMNFNGLASRNPSTSGDYVGIWQNPGIIPFGQAPQSQQSVSQTSPNGSMLFSGLNLSALPYVIGYSAGSDANGKNIVAAIPISGGVPGLATLITLGIAAVGTTNLAMSYTCPAGMDPLSLGHSLVLVKGQTYNPTSPATTLATTPTTDNQTDVVSLTANMTMGQYFTVAYLAGAKPVNVAATVTFQVANPS
jgi:hypothetical protein